MLLHRRSNLHLCFCYEWKGLSTHLLLTSRTHPHGQPPIASLHSHLPFPGQSAMARTHRCGDQADEGEPLLPAVLAIRGHVHAHALTPRHRALTAVLFRPEGRTGPVPAAASRPHDHAYDHLRRGLLFFLSLLARGRIHHQEEHPSHGLIISRAYPASGSLAAADPREGRACSACSACSACRACRASIAVIAEPRGCGGGPALRGEGCERQATHGAHRQPRAARAQCAQEGATRGDRHQPSAGRGGRG